MLKQYAHICIPHYLPIYSARCTEAFLVDLVKASVNKVESDRKPDMKRKHLQQVLPEDV